MKKLILLSFLSLSLQAQVSVPCIPIWSNPVAPSIFPLFTCVPIQTFIQNFVLPALPTSQQKFGNTGNCSNPTTSTQPILVIKSSDGTCQQVQMVLPGQTADSSFSPVFRLTLHPQEIPIYISIKG